MGKIKTFLLMFGLVILFMYVGNLIGGQSGMVSAFWIALLMNFFSYFFSDKLVLKHYKAQEVDERHSPDLYMIVKRLAQNAGLSMPKVYIIPENAPNAFATGRNPKHAAVAVTEGLLNLMNKEEIEGVLAHEMSHIRHHDILISTIAAVFAGAISMLGRMGGYTVSRNGQQRERSVLALIAMPIAATIIQMSISRTREFAADKGAAELTGHPEWLMAALSKLEEYAHSYKMQRANSQTAHMFIVNPFLSFNGGLSSLFSTHPSTARRIAELEKIYNKINH